MPNNDECQDQILNAAAAVIIRQGSDKTTMGNYLRRRDNLFAWMQSGSLGADFIQARPGGR